MSAFIKGYSSVLELHPQDDFADLIAAADPSNVQCLSWQLTLDELYSSMAAREEILARALEQINVNVEQSMPVAAAKGEVLRKLGDRLRSLDGKILNAIERRAARAR